jgi:hypothetical protein
MARAPIVAKRQRVLAERRLPAGGKQIHKCMMRKDLRRWAGLLVAVVAHRLQCSPVNSPRCLRSSPLFFPSD